MPSISPHHLIELKRVVNLPSREVHAAWTEPKAMEGWLGRIEITITVWECRFLGASFDYPVRALVELVGVENAKCDGAQTKATWKLRIPLCLTVYCLKQVMRLHMLKAMEATNDIVFALQPQGDTTAVSWRMSGAYPFINKVFCVVFDMDKMIGDEFEKGLADLQQIAEN